MKKYSKPSLTSPLRYRRHSHLRKIRLDWLTIPFIGKYLAGLALKKVFPLTGLRRHVYIVAKSGSGKSELLKLLILRLKQVWSSNPFRARVNTKMTVVLIDPHGDTAFDCARQSIFDKDFQQAQKRNTDPNLIFLSLQGNSESLPCLNPFDLEGKKYSESDLEIRAQFLSRTFSSMLGRGDDRLSLHMKTLLTPSITVLLAKSQAYTDTPPTLSDLERILDDDRNDDLLRFASQKMENDHIRTFFAQTFTQKRFANSKFALRVRLLHCLFSPTFSALMNRPRSTWSLRAALESGKTILIDASRSVLGPEGSEMYGRTLTALIQSHVFLRTRKRKKMPIYLALEEAPSFVCDDIKTILEQARKFGLHLILVTQLIGQGGIRPELQDSILANTGIKMTGQSNYRSRSRMAQEYEVPTEAFRRLRVGEFLINSSANLPKRVRMPRCWLGRRGSMPSQQFSKLMAFLSQRYGSAISKQSRNFEKMKPERKGDAPQFPFSFRHL